MNLLKSLLLTIAALQSVGAFVVPPSGTSVSTVSSTGALSMGLFDFFSEDARMEREARKQREIAEQERLQQEILERRKNPEMMEEYEAKVRVRRALRMAGEDEKANAVEVFSDS